MVECGGAVELKITLNKMLSVIITIDSRNDTMFKFSNI